MQSVQCDALATKGAVVDWNRVEVAVRLSRLGRLQLRVLRLLLKLLLKVAGVALMGWERGVGLGLEQRQ